MKDIKMLRGIELKTRTDGVVGEGKAFIKVEGGKI